MQKIINVHFRGWNLMVHQTYCSSDLLFIRPIVHQTYSPSGLLSNRPIVHRTYWPSDLLSIKPTIHQTYCPSDLLYIRPNFHQTYCPSDILQTFSLLQTFFQLLMQNWIETWIILNINITTLYLKWWFTILEKLEGALMFTSFYHWY